MDKMAAIGVQLVLWGFFLVGFLQFAQCEHKSATGKPCSYFGESRVSSPQGNLVNCTWYATNACCKRTEVTSVFGSMYPLDGASKDCTNMVNYLMCYFCSPDQYLWYDRKVHVCAEYCDVLFDTCKEARYQGIAIGDEYHSGEEFCRGQKFEVVEGKSQCFDFDPLVFGGSPTHSASWTTLLCLSSFYFLFSQMSDKYFHFLL